MSKKNYILETWVEKLLANPITKIAIKSSDLKSFKNIVDFTVFLFNTHGWNDWQHGQNEFEKWLKKVK